MNAALDAIREQNRLIKEQNALLRQLAIQSEATAQEATTGHGRMMTDYDLRLILMADDIYDAIDRWNAGCSPRRIPRCNRRNRKSAL